MISPEPFERIPPSGLHIRSHFNEVDPYIFASVNLKGSLLTGKGRVIVIALASLHIRPIASLYDVMATPQSRATTCNSQTDLDICRLAQELYGRKEILKIELDGDKFLDMSDLVYDQEFPNTDHTISLNDLWKLGWLKNPYKFRSNDKKKLAYIQRPDSITDRLDSLNLLADGLPSPLGRRFVLDLCLLSAACTFALVTSVRSLLGPADCDGFRLCAFGGLGDDFDLGGPCAMRFVVDRKRC